jgi:hypothetical protein
LCSRTHWLVSLIHRSRYRETVNETVSSGNFFAEREGVLLTVHTKPSWLTVATGVNGSVGYLSGTPTAVGGSSL